MTRFLKALAFVTLFLISAGFASAEERWQTLPEPAAMPKPIRAAMRRSTASRCTMPFSAPVIRCC